MASGSLRRDQPGVLVSYEEPAPVAIPLVVHGPYNWLDAFDAPDAFEIGPRRAQRPRTAAGSITTISPPGCCRAQRPREGGWRHDRELEPSRMAADHTRRPAAASASGS